MVVGSLVGWLEQSRCVLVWTGACGVSGVEWSVRFSSVVVRQYGSQAVKSVQLWQALLATETECERAAGHSLPACETGVRLFHLSNPIVHSYPHVWLVAVYVSKKECAMDVESAVWLQSECGIAGAPLLVVLPRLARQTGVECRFVNERSTASYS